VARAVKDQFADLLERLGLLATPILDRHPNVGHCQTLWTVVDLPDGLEPVRFYMVKDRDSRPDPACAEVGHNGGSLLARAPGKIAINDFSHTSSTLEVQIEPSGTIVSAVGVTLLIFIVSTFVYRHTTVIVSGSDADGVIAVATVFSGIPAVLTGAIAYRGNYLSRKISRLPRLLLGILAGSAALMAVVVALRLGHVGFLRGLSLGTLAYSCALAGMLVHVQLGPRFRQGHLARWPKTMSRRSPRSCRQWQAACATFFCMTWTFVTVLVVLVEVKVAGIAMGNVNGPEHVLTALRAAL
jgi:hypothetical protein